MSKALATTLPWYCNKGLSQEIQKEAESSLSKLDWSNPVLVLRDFHAQNLIYRYEQSGLAQMGVLDFQDAQLGHPLYDVTSLIHDARRILSPSVVSLLLQELTKTYRGQDDFKYASEMGYTVKHLAVSKINNKEIELREEPNLRSEEIIKLHEGTKLNVVESINDWSLIQLKNGNKGWITTSSFRLVKW